MKKLAILACALLIGGLTAQAQEKSDVIAAQSGKKVVQNETALVQKTTEAAPATSDETNGQDTKAPAGMDKILREREERAAAIRAAKKKENQNRATNSSTSSTGIKKSKPKVVTKEMLEAEKIEKQKKATKKDN